MAKKRTTPAPLTMIELTIEQLQLFETFLQYGDLAYANLIFMGMEEGLDGLSYPDMENVNHLYSLAIDARRKLLDDESYKSTRVFLNGKDFKDGWYINDSKYLTNAQALITPAKYVAPKPSLTIWMQARMHWLLKDKKNRLENYSLIPKDFNDYKYSLSKANNNALIDYFPLPNHGKGAFPYEYGSLFTNRQTYESYYNRLCVGNNRYRILKNAYDNNPMKVSFSYSEFKKGIFGLHKFYSSLDFVFDPPYNTNMVKEGYTGPIQPNLEKGKQFLIGKRKNLKGMDQKVILTPFWGTGQFSYNDIDVVSTYV